MEDADPAAAAAPEIYCHVCTEPIEPPEEPKVVEVAKIIGGGRVTVHERCTVDAIVGLANKMLRRGSQA